MAEQNSGEAKPNSAHPVNAERLAALELAVSRLYELADAVMDVRGTELPAPPQFDASGSWVAGEEFERAKWLAEMVFYDRDRNLPDDSDPDRRKRHGDTYARWTDPDYFSRVEATARPAEEAGDAER